MTGLPTVQVLLDDGTGNYPYDVTAYARMPDGISWTRGRQDELSENQAGSLSLTFDNTDGRFSYGSGTYNIAVDQGIRFKVNGATRWTGRVQSWSVSWPQGGQEYAVAQVSAIDDFARMQRRTLDSATVEEITLDVFGTTAAFWPCSDPVATPVSQAVDLNGNAPSLVTTFAAPTVQFAQSLGTPDGANGVQFQSHTTQFSSAFLQYNQNGLPWHVWFAHAVFNSIHFEITFNLSGNFTTGHVVLVGAAPALIDYGLEITMTQTQLQIRQGYGANTYNVSISSPVGLHSIAFDSDGTSNVVTMDGAVIDSRAGFASTYDMTLGLGIGIDFYEPAGTLTMQAGNIVIGPKLSSTRSIAHQNAALTDEAGETPAQRFARLVAYTDTSAGTIDSTGTTTLGPANQGGRTLADCILDTADADLGVGYVDANGALSYISGMTLAGVTDVSMDANWLDESVALTADAQTLVNYATGQAGSNGTLQVAYNAASINEHGRYAQTYTWNVNTDIQAVYRTQWEAYNYAEPVPRCPTLIADLLTMDATNVSNLLTVDLQDLLQITGLPSQTPGGTTAALVVTGITETISADEWTLTFNCVQRSLVGAWVLGDATYGVLGTTTKLYV